MRSSNKPQRSKNEHDRMFSVCKAEKSGMQNRTGSGSVEMVLILGVILVLLALVFPVARRMIQLTFEMTSVLISWPFM